MTCYLYEVCDTEGNTILSAGVETDDPNDVRVTRDGTAVRLMFENIIIDQNWASTEDAPLGFLRRQCEDEQVKPVFRWVS
jgi:hypothetical protein